MVGPAAVSSPSASRPRGSAKIRVLLCDDQALFRSGMRAVLGVHPMLEVVGEAGDGRGALEAVERLRPHVVLMDVELPGLDGVETTRRLAQTHHDVKVLILSMHLEGQLVTRCLEAGASGYVLKDVPVPELARAIEAVAGGGRYLSPAALAKLIDHTGQAGEPTRTSYDRLTEREREVLKLLASGLSVKEVAARLDRSVKTAEAHTYNLMQKLDLHERAGLVRYAIAHGVIQVPVPDDRPEPASASPPGPTPVHPATHPRARTRGRRPQAESGGMPKSGFPRSPRTHR